MVTDAINEAIDEGCSPEFVLFIKTAPNNHKAVEKLIKHYERGTLHTYGESHFYNSIWTGDIDKAYRHADIENKKVLEEAFPNK